RDREAYRGDSGTHSSHLPRAHEPSRGAIRHTLLLTAARAIGCSTGGCYVHT
ncbi:unnamed protein product, partial [Closterium sp. NIES-65]